VIRQRKPKREKKKRVKKETADLHSHDICSQASSSTITANLSVSHWKSIKTHTHPHSTVYASQTLIVTQATAVSTVTVKKKKKRQKERGGWGTEIKRGLSLRTDSGLSMSHVWMCLCHSRPLQVCSLHTLAMVQINWLEQTSKLTIFPIENHNSQCQFKNH